MVSDVRIWWIRQPDIAESWFQYPGGRVDEPDGRIQLRMGMENCIRV